ncbi:MAG: hypothetical protein HC806_04760 [Anaerolineae bacterium]|nr:hypothetical protein [Anaerolineae bacterium]
MFVLFFLSKPIYAQDNELELSLNRDWGYGGFGGEIQGRFSLRATGPDSLIEVRFMIDDIVVETSTKPPFNYQFETDEFTPGVHTLTAVGILSDGSQIDGPKYQRVFLSAEECTKRHY